MSGGSYGAGSGAGQAICEHLSPSYLRLPHPVPLPYLSFTLLELYRAHLPGRLWLT